MKARLTLKVHAGARETRFAGKHQYGWKLHVAAPPVDGKANEAIIRYLSKLAGTPSGSVRIVTGFTSASKIVEIDGIGPEMLERAILDTHGSPSDTASAAPPEA
jgi:uncharacterized protein YggU (UPF0235/DUF167 family)